ncbi:MAG: hypothetical protein UZ21_OP11001000721 [Microgenomates bacterium OLB22]|nr:MAG: hypothetical protein UZ21_OP11001000721 [Microgenomates bacterium OLB22]
MLVSSTIQAIVDVEFLNFGTENLRSIGIGVVQKAIHDGMDEIHGVIMFFFICRLFGYDLKLIPAVSSRSSSSTSRSLSVGSDP